MFVIEELNNLLNKYLDVTDILLLRISYKNNFKIEKKHNYERDIKLYSNFNIDKRDVYKINLIIYDSIRYINEDTIVELKKRNINKIDKIKIKEIKKNIREPIVYINQFESLINLILLNYNCRILDIKSYNLKQLELEIIYKFKYIYLNDINIYLNLDNEKDLRYFYLNFYSKELKYWI